jgi:hypothetical protein
MADMFETVIGAAEPALKMVAGLVEGLKEAGQKFVAEALAPVLADLKAQGGGAAAAAPEPAPAPRAAPAPAAAARPAARVRPLRAPGR